MEVKQVYELVNDVASEALGKESVLNEDLGNLVDVGTEIFDANAVDNYVGKLIDRIGRTIFVDRIYRGSAPSVMMDAWEYGSVCEKISVDLPEASEDESWKLVDGASYDSSIFYAPKISVKFFNNKSVFEIDGPSITRKQLRESFNNGTELNAFVSMIQNATQKAMTLRVDELIRRTINSMTANTIYDAFGSTGAANATSVRAVNLLYEYNQQFNQSLTKAKCWSDPEFIRFFCYKLGLYSDRMGQLSTLFNIGGKDRFTPKDMLHIVMLSEIGRAANVYLQSETFHNEFTALPNAEMVSYWQGSGTDYAFGSTSKINVKTQAGDTVEYDGILAVMFDRDALGVTNLDRNSRSHYSAKGDFYNYFYGFEMGAFNDLNENFVVFGVWDGTEVE